MNPVKIARTGLLISDSSVRPMSRVQGNSASAHCR